MLATTELSEPSGLLHEGFAKQVRTQPSASALICADHVWTYAALGAKAAAVANQLQSWGLAANSVVVVAMDKGWEQIVAVLGVLGAGTAYLVFDPSWEEARARRWLGELRVAAVLTQPRWASRLAAWMPSRTLVVDRSIGNGPGPSSSLSPSFPPSRSRREDAAWWEMAPSANPDGDESVPRGSAPQVRALSHRVGVRTMDELTRRCDIDNEDRALALAPLESRVALPDLFGLLRVGGTLIVPQTSEAHDVRQWWELMEDYEATVLSTTTACLTTLLDYCLARGVSWLSGRVVLLAADWIPVRLPGQLRRFASGAKLMVVREDPTSASRIAALLIDEVDPGWVHSSGSALDAPPFMVLDEALRPAPPDVPGNLYLKETATSAAWRLSPTARARLLSCPHSNERLFRTGHVGRVRASGDVEFAAPNEFQRALRSRDQHPSRALPAATKGQPPAAARRWGVG